MLAPAVWYGTGTSITSQGRRLLWVVGGWGGLHFVV